MIRAEHIRKLGSNLNIASLWLLIASTGPFIFNILEGYPHKPLIAILLVIMAVQLVVQRRIVIADIMILLIISVQVTYFSVMTIVYANPWYMTNITFLLGLIIVYLYIYTTIGIDAFIRSLTIVVAAMAVLGVIGFMLALTGLKGPDILYYRSENEPVYSFLVTFTNTIFAIGDGWLIRVGGFFNEGGTLGFYLIHALIVNRLSGNSRKIEGLLLISGLFTFSFAFYISTVFYFLFFYLNRKTAVRLAAISLVILLFFGTIMALKQDYSLASYIYDMVFRRFEPGEDGNLLMGNNRWQEVLDSISPFFSKPVFGHGIDFVLDTNPEAIATIMGPLVAYGVIGSFIYFLHVVYLFVLAIPLPGRRDNTILPKCLLIIAINYLQRPFVLSMLSYLFLIMLSELFRRHSAENRTIPAAERQDTDLTAATA